MSARWQSILLAILLVPIGCSNKSEEDIQAVDTEETIDAVMVSPDIPPMPSKSGIFGVREGKFTELEAGSTKRLMPTNADRGFGFSAPIGKRISQKTSSFRFVGQALDLSQIILTRYKGIAVPTDTPYTPVDDANTAWIPYEEIPADLTVYDAERGLAELTPHQPLVPGFYAIHDDTLFTARTRAEVTAYYPIIISGSTPPWISESIQCFEAAHEIVEKKPMFTRANASDRASLKNCLQMQRLAIKASTAANNEEQALDSSLRTAYLARLIDDADHETHRHILTQMDASGNGLPNALYKLELGSHMAHLSNLYHQVSSGFALSGDDVRAILDFYTPKDSLKSPSSEYVEESPAEPIASLDWLPFVTLEPDDETLETIFSTMLKGKSWNTHLIESIGAIHYLHIHGMPRDQWAKQLEHDAPHTFKTRASKMHLRTERPSIALGPYHFTGIPTDEINAWQASIEAKHTEVMECLTDNKRSTGTFLILKLPLNGGTIGNKLGATLTDPIPNHAKQVISPQETQCIINAFKSLPVAPALENNKTVQLGIAIPPTEG